MKRKTETKSRGSFLESIANVLWKVFKKIAELLIRLIKAIIKEVWHNA